MKRQLKHNPIIGYHAIDLAMSVMGPPGTELNPAFATEGKALESAKRYRQEAEEKNLPHWNRFVIAQLEENAPDAIIAQHGYNTPHDPEFPKTLPSYEEAYAWLERKLTKRALDGLKAEPYFDDTLPEERAAHLVELEKRRK